MRPTLLAVSLTLTLSMGCTATEATDDVIVDLGYQVDPHVNTYIPDGYRATDPQRVIFLGDSITKGAGSTGLGLKYTKLLSDNHDAKWAGWGEHDLSSLFGEVEVVDVSRNGAQTTDLISDQLPNVSELIGDAVSGETIVVMTIGGNDMQAAIAPIITATDKEAAYQQRIAPTITRFGTIIDYFQDSDRFPDGTFIYMTNVYEPTDNVGQTDACFFGFKIGDALPYLDRANDEVRELAIERGTASIDLRGHFLGHGHNFANSTMDSFDEPDPTLWLAEDCIHPNDRGHHEVRRLFLTAIDGRQLEAFGDAP
ncbi:MAG: lysophospholipase L1-like esterase [Kiritimatiellia bacterium]|jgi:lysophospholipase L1-like esterase